MDESHELQRFKYLLVAVVVFLVSGFFAYGELRYALFARTADGVCTQVVEHSNYSRRGRRERLIVRYRFTDTDGAVRTEDDEVRSDWPVQQSEAVRVKFIPGRPGASRLEGHSYMGAVYIFFASLAGVGFFVFQFWRFYKS